MSKFWKVVNEAASETAELLLYGDIASEKPWWDEGDTVSPKQFADDLAALGGKDVTVRINSPGGDVFAAHAIASQLRSYAGNVTVQIDGLAASAATIVMMAGKTVTMPSNAMIMIHNPMFVLWGYYNADELDRMSSALGAIKDSIINAYLTRATCDRKKLDKLMSDETWMTAETAKGYGLCDEVTDLGTATDNIVVDGSFLVVNSVRHDLTHVANAEQLRNIIAASKTNNKPTQPNPDSILAEAKKLLSTVVNLVTPNKNNKEEKELDIKTVDDLKKNFPDLVNQLTQEASNTALQAEKNRITALDALDDSKNPALHEIVEQAKNSGKTAEDIKAVVDVLKKHAPAPAAPQNKGLTFLNSVIQDNKGSGVDNVSSETPSGTTDQQEEAAAANFMAGVMNKKLGGKK